jgi:hypothetical protein
MSVWTESLLQAVEKYMLMPIKTMIITPNPAVSFSAIISVGFIRTSTTLSVNISSWMHGILSSY